jgi:hypothetical protein
MTTSLLAIALLAASPLPSVVRGIEATPGRVAVVLDRDVYDVAREDLGDLRVLDGAGRLVPYVLDRGRETSTRIAPRVIDRSFTRGTLERVTLDFGARTWKRELALRLSGDNFRRRVIVEGSDDGASWATLTDGAYVFAVPGPIAARYETVAFPENEQRYLRVTVRHAEGDPDRIEVYGVDASTTGRREGPSRTLSPRALREEDSQRRETLVTLELGSRHQPFRGIVLEADDPRFMRGVRVEARREGRRARPGEEAQRAYWVPIGEGCVYRYDDSGRRLESLRIDVTGREETLRLRIRNADDRPLRLGSIRVVAPIERVLFEAAAGESYRLAYGVESLGPPTFDLARTMGDLDAWAASSTPGRLAGPVRISREGRPPWTEAHPELLWAGLVVAVAVLGWLTRRALTASSS